MYIEKGIIEMKNHLGSCLVIGLLILSGATSLASPAPTQTMLRLDSAAFPAPTAAVINGETTLAIQGCDQTTGIPGEPLLPVQRRTYEFPLGTTITTIQVTPEATFTAALPAPVTMTPRPQIDTLTTTPSIAPSPVYTQDQPYPMAWYSSQLTGGLNSQDQPTAFLTLELHPVRYNPVQQTLLYATSFSIDIHYTPSSSPRTLANETRFVIITTDSYKNLLTPLMDHKMAHGISTKIVTISDITKRDA